MNITTLVYFERNIRNNCMPLLSETVHASREEAILELWKYVAGSDNHSGMIEEKCLAEFVEAMRDNEFDIRMFDYTSDNDEQITHEELKALFQQTSTETKEEVINWYFNLMDDETTEADYRIKEHTINQE